MNRVLTASASLAACLMMAAPAYAFDVAVYGAPGNNSWNDDVVNKIQATGQFDSVTGHLVRSGFPVPSLADLQQYDAVLVYSDTSFNNNTSMGNVLADYMDAGGGVVLSTFVFWDTLGLSIQGRIKTDGYLPFTTASQASPNGLTLVTVDGSHPIMDNVSSLNGGTSSYHNTSIAVKAGVNHVANWSNGQPLIGEWSPAASDGTIVGLNFYPPSQNARSDFWNASTDGDIIMANALTFAAGGAAPSADAGGPYTAFEGAPVLLDGSLSTSTAGISLYEWDCTDDGTYDFSSASPTMVGCVYPDDGAETLRLRVTDINAVTAEATAEVTIGNVSPQILAQSINGGDEGVALDFSVTVEDVPADTVTYSWDFGDGSPIDNTSGALVSHAYADDGLPTVELTLTDEDGGLTVVQIPLIIDNVPPTLQSSSVPSGSEGDLLDFDAVATDVAADTIGYMWDFGDGSPTVSGSSGATQHTFADDGTYTVTLTLTDEDGGLIEHEFVIDIGNVAPSIDFMDGPSEGDEGTLLPFSAFASDASADDAANLTFTWNWGDSSLNSTGDSLTHAFPDEGVYTVTLDVDDGDGGVATSQLTVTINNVAPTITSSALTAATQGFPYNYQATAFDPGLTDNITWSLSASSPVGMTVDAGTGAISWAPDYDDSQNNPHAVTLIVDDGDGGTDAQTWTITVGASDLDGDGMDDGWEEDNGLDPTNALDAFDDPDGDGLTNLDEFQGGTDPNEYDGPSIPVLTDPIAGAEVAEAAPNLYWLNAIDPQGDVLTYDVEVYEDDTLASLVVATTAVVEDASGTSTWKVTTPLAENTSYVWRASASDPHVSSAWTDVEEFFVNEVEELPDVPTPLYPVDGETLAVSPPFLEWTTVEDPDLDAVTYDVQVWDADAVAVVSEAADLEVTELTGTWEPDPALVENTWYQWTVRAVDEHGNATEWAEPEPFFLSSENEAATGVVLISPEQDEEVETVSPTLVATEGVDPEGTALQYRFEVDSVDTYDSGDFITFSVGASDTGTVSWDLSDTGDELVEHAIAYARVRAQDGDGVNTPWDSISFLVRGENDPPAVPELLLPEYGAVTPEHQPWLVAAHVTDPEEDAVTYDFIVAANPTLSDVLATGLLVEPGAGDEGSESQVSWQVDVAVDGDIYWSARAVDEGGAASEWAEPFLLRVEEVVGDDDDSAVGDDDDDDDASGGCDCENSIAGGVTFADDGALALLALLPLAVLLRRRR